jgi:hypothetical protein
MAAKQKTTPPAKRNANTLQVANDVGKSKERKLAEVKLSAETANAITACSYRKSSMGEIELTEAISVMRENVSKVNAGDLTELEGTLTAQALSLDAMFNEMARRAALNMGEYMQATESYMRLALKAQAQCARTIEVLAGMKNPPVVFAKQANISHGHQQVNNETNTHSPAHTGKTINQQNELLSEDNHATLDTCGTGATSGTDKAMAAVE